MKRGPTIQRITFSALLVLLIGGPAVIALDPWDAFPDSGDTSIVFLWAAALCLGISYLLTRGMQLFQRAAHCAASVLPRFTLPAGSVASRAHSPFRTMAPLRI